ncbi:MAG: hypothetical protein Fur0039_24800 [Rhodocyclaceae bacterium]
MHTDRGVQRCVRLGQGPYGREILQIHCDAQRMADPRARHRVENLRNAAGELREVEMTVGIDEHVQRVWVERVEAMCPPSTLSIRVFAA